MARSTSISPTLLKDESKRKSLSSSSSSSVVVSLISILGFYHPLLLYISSKIRIVGFSAYAQPQPLPQPQPLQLQ